MRIENLVTGEGPGRKEGEKRGGRTGGGKKHERLKTKETNNFIPERKRGGGR